MTTYKINHKRVHGACHMEKAHEDDISCLRDNMAYMGFDIPHMTNFAKSILKCFLMDFNFSHGMSPDGP